MSGNDNVAGEYRLTDGGNVVGYILSLKGQGYGRAFTMLASYRNDGEILAAKMMTDGETPGLGKKERRRLVHEEVRGNRNEGQTCPDDEDEIIQGRQ